MKPRVLFVTEKWFGGNPNLSFTNNFHNLFNSFSSSLGHEFTWNTIHVDESYSVYGKHVDEIVPRYCEENNIRIIFYCLLGSDFRNPSLETYQKLKSQNVLQCFMWPDTASWALAKINELKGLADLHVSWDYSSSKIDYADNHLCLWAPQDKSLFYPDEQIIDVSFVGSKHHRDRRLYLPFIQAQIPNILISGGQGEAQLTPQIYASIIRKSKINLNFSLHPLGFDQIKGRVFETLGSKSLLLERANEMTKKLFSPGVEYVEFDNPQDAVDKIKYFLSNEKEREKIAENGYRAYFNRHSPDIFWRTIMNKLLKL